MKLWEKGDPLDKQIEAFTVGEDYLLDQKLVKYDCLASIAHAKMLARIGMLTAAEAQKLTDTLKEIIQLHQQGNFPLRREQEDCHTAIENLLTQKLGDIGKKIHTARSRNDQVLTALRLYYKDAEKELERQVQEFNSAISQFVKKYGRIKLPGYTHSRKAMPSSIRLWGRAFIDGMRENLKVLALAGELNDQSPLGTGAGYGLPIKLDRRYTAQLQGFKRVQKNPIHVQLSRGKFESTLVHALSQIMHDLNRLASDLILFSMPEFGFFQLPAAFCTGSSIMPQKQNPDVLELLRAKYHAVVAYEMQIKNTVANLTTGYHRDVQLTKEPTMKSLEITHSCLAISILIFSQLQVDKKKCHQALTAELYATEEVYKLVKQGVPFREAYQMVAKKFR
ncbi:MAG: argininosuccinate lyase [bacterium]